MGDIWVHVRMKECCRATLRDLDKRKKQASFEGGVLGVRSLFEALGEKTIDEALGALAGGGKAGGKMEELTRAACVKVCQQHAADHHGKGETEEGDFWHETAAVMTGKPNAKATALKAAADSALNQHPKFCNKSTAAVASAMGYDQLQGMTANQQVDYLSENWYRIDAQAAQSMANAGDLVIAGLKSKKSGGHGHTAVVVPGSGATKPDDGFYPNVEGGAMNPAGYSDGSKTAGDVWSTSDRSDVEYFTPIPSQGP